MEFNWYFWSNFHWSLNLLSLLVLQIRRNWFHIKASTILRTSCAIPPHKTSPFPIEMISSDGNAMEINHLSQRQRSKLKRNYSRTLEYRKRDRKEATKRCFSKQRLFFCRESRTVKTFFFYYVHIRDDDEVMFFWWLLYYYWVSCEQFFRVCLLQRGRQTLRDDVSVCLRSWFRRKYPRRSRDVILTKQWSKKLR